MNNDGTKNDGTKNDGTKNDGIKNDGKKNPLDAIKEAIRVKPIVEEEPNIEIVIPKRDKTQKKEKKEKKGADAEFLDERESNKDFDINKLRKQLETRKMTKIVTKDTVKLSEKEKREITKQEQEQEEPKLKKVKKMNTKAVPIIPEGKEDDDDYIYMDEKKTEKPIIIEKQDTRKTARHTYGVSIITPDQWLDIDNEKVIDRLPRNKPNINIKVSSYYMNNREIFVNFLNSLFEPYRDEIMNDTSQITCENMNSKSNSEISLLTHQKLVRDYMNNYTPYRGLLVYHGLGSGKTATSIALAEGMKHSKKVIIMTPKSLRRNYFEEMKKFGDPIYKINQFWEWISIQDKPELLQTLSSVLGLSTEYIEKKKGAWLVDIKKPSNYNDLNSNEVKSLNEQIDEMIQSKYKFINYNGLRLDKLREMTDDFQNNIFDDAVVVIDEAHNLISRIVNKIDKGKVAPIGKKEKGDEKGEEKGEENGEEKKKKRSNYSLSLTLYELLMNAQNARVILLSGTPVINYPNEIGILFNILRGYIKTWELPLVLKGGQSNITKEKLQEILKREKVLDFIDYSNSTKKLTITRNPFGFENIDNKRGIYTGVSNEKKEKMDKTTGKSVLVDRGTISDSDFQRKIINILSDNNIEVLKSNIKIIMNKALPDVFDDFVNRFVEINTGNMKNNELFQRRILGLTSYFRSAQEKLLPKYEKAIDFHIVKINMSDYQFKIYEEARQQERKLEKSAGQKKGVMDKDGIFKEPSSTYRIFSRLYCNFVMPRPPGRPLPDRKNKKAEDIAKKGEDATKKAEDIAEKGEDENANKELNQVYTELVEEKKRKDTAAEEVFEGDWQGNVEGDESLDQMGDNDYKERIQKTIQYIKEHGEEILSPSGLETYSPKYLHILENIQDEKHEGLHLVYSQFRTLEGIGIFKMVLEQNGFAQFKIVKNNSGNWELDMDEEDRGKPTFALYTGTESDEEKEIIRNIYNSNWENISLSSPDLYKELNDTALSNKTGEIIKVLMITASGTEGINLRNTRYVHIMEPYWHAVRLEQVIGRARRICSHKDLPESQQTVEVFLYLMAFTTKQLESDDSIELKLKDISKKMYNKIDKNGKEKMDYIPLTSDEALFEISSIKENVNEQILKSIKESSIDCAIYSRSDSKEQLNCIQFGQLDPNVYTYNPSIHLDETDNVSQRNKKTIEWTGNEVKIKGKTYILRVIDERNEQLYDYDSYQRALQNPKNAPVLLATIKIDDKGVRTVKKV